MTSFMNVLYVHLIISRIVLDLRHVSAFRNKFKLPSDGDEMGDGGRGKAWDSVVVKVVPGNDCLPPPLLRPRGVAIFFTTGDFFIFNGVLRTRFGVLTVVDTS